jgi:hypothetical protein
LTHPFGLLRGGATGGSLRHAEDVGADQWGHDLEVEPVEFQQAEAGGGDGGGDVAVGVAACG